MQAAACECGFEGRHETVRAFDPAALGAMRLRIDDEIRIAACMRCPLYIQCPDTQSDNRPGLRTDRHGPNYGRVLLASWECSELQPRLKGDHSRTAIATQTDAQ